MSNIIHSNYFRSKTVDHIVADGEALVALINAGLSKKKIEELKQSGTSVSEAFYAGLKKRLAREHLDEIEYRDRYEELLKQLISKKDEASDPEKVELDLEELVADDGGELDDML